MQHHIRLANERAAWMKLMALNAGKTKTKQNKTGIRQKQDLLKKLNIRDKGKKSIMIPLWLLFACLFGFSN